VVLTGTEVFNLNNCKNVVSSEEEKEGRVTGSFDSFTYWNYDR
jgi:hypothetical protein